MYVSRALYIGIAESGTKERNLFLEQSQNIFIFSASCKIVVASKRLLIVSTARQKANANVGQGVAILVCRTVKLAVKIIAEDIGQYFVDNLADLV